MRKRIRDGERLSVDFEKALIAQPVPPGKRIAFEPIPPHLLQMVRDGGLLPASGEAPCANA